MSLSLIVFFGAFLLLSIFDLWIDLKRGTYATISWQMLLAAKRYPIISFTFGVIAGHLFWNQGC